MISHVWDSNRKDILMEKGKTVRVHYKGTLDDGTVFDSSENRDPLEFQVGMGQMIPGFDAAVLEMEVGDKKTVHIPAAEAYGEVDPSRIAKIPREKFPSAENAPIGVRIMLSGPGGAMIPAVITSIDDKFVTVDFNHELAGKALNFEIELVEVVD
ncbi:MAG: FKBP-type peptidyl-prolyl cis-trans isomerase [Coriobacteriales bacterium]